MIAQNSSETVSTLEKKITKALKNSAKKREQVEKNMKDSSSLQEELRDLKVEQDGLKNIIKDAEKKIKRLKNALEGKEEPKEQDTTEIDQKLVSISALPLRKSVSLTNDNRFTFG